MGLAAHCRCPTIAALALFGKMDSSPIALSPAVLDAAQPSAMDEESFLAFYAQTALPLRAYLCRMLVNSSLSDDLLQESYLRLLRAHLPAEMDSSHRKNYLFRIATNLLRDEANRRHPLPLLEIEPAASGLGRLSRDLDGQHDLERSLSQLKPRERQLLWLAYVEGFSHSDIAAIVGAAAQSIRPMLSRARDHFTLVLRDRGIGGPGLKSGPPSSDGPKENV